MSRHIMVKHKNLITILNQPEIILLLLCSSVRPSESEHEKIKKIAASRLDWSLICRLAIEHRIFPLLYKNIKSTIFEDVPDWAIQKLKNATALNTTRNLYLTSILLRHLDLFHSNQIRAVPFKGPVLAEDVYGDIGLRYFSDLDILVSPNDVQSSYNLLIKNNYKPTLNINEKQLQKYINSEDELSFFNKTSNTIIELHWELSGRYLSTPLFIDVFNNRLKQIAFHSRPILVLSNEDLLIYLCIHGSRHGWVNIEQICSIAELIKKSSINWTTVEATAVDWKCFKILDLGLHLAWRFFNLDLPESIRLRLIKNRPIENLSQRIASSIFYSSIAKKTENFSSRFSPFHLKIRDSFLDKLRYVGRLLFSPTEKEWLYYPFPTQLAFLHYLLRPFRLIKEKFKEKNA